MFSALFYLKMVQEASSCNESDINSFLHTTSMVFCGAKAEANIDAELRLNCAQPTLLVNLVSKSYLK